ncbi:MAG: hypothetical protein Q9195_007750 [Heterodermia aff. obscurata]
MDSRVVRARRYLESLPKRGRQRFELQAVTVSLGTNKAGEALSTVDLHPGGQWGSQVLTSKVCDNAGSSELTPCLASAAGFYNPNNSQTAVQGTPDDTGAGPSWELRAFVARDESFGFSQGLDTMRMNTSQGSITAVNCSVFATETTTLGLPEGQTYTVPVGHLALGFSGQGRLVYEIDQNISSYKFPGALATNNTIPSNSFGLHYGSASLDLDGSLTWGGFDQSRVLGDVGAFSLSDDGGQDNIIVQLLDIQIKVEQGAFPFSATSNTSEDDAPTSYTGLLSVDMDSGIQPTNLHPMLSYMYMDPATCSAIVEHLPVTLQRFTNLYIWNTSDPSFARIMQSSAHLDFVFENSGHGNLTIKVPFQLLNLTLDAPIVSPPVQYFPCQPFHASDGSNHYFLGKSFLQAAFLGMNWEQRKFFLAQAPGPGATAPNLQDISTDATMISSNPIADFASSWSGVWKTTAQKNSSTSQTTPSDTNSDGPNTTSSTPTPNGGDGLSAGAKAGIAIGVVVAVIVVLGLIFILLRRRRNMNAALMPQPGMPAQNGLAYEKDGHQVVKPVEKDGRHVGSELHGEELAYEIGGESQRRELATH